MRVGVSLTSSFAVQDHREGPRWMLEQAAAAARAGLDVLSVGDHHSTGPGSYVQNVPILARMLALWDERPAGCLFLVPLWHPVLMAEQIGTLAALAHGPFVIQAGVGGGRAQFGAMGVDLGERGRLMEEGVLLVQRLLAGDEVSSERWGIRSARIAPLPPAGTEWWIGGAAPAALDRAARLGDCWYGSPELTVATARELLDRYREACARHDRRPVRIPIRKDVFLAQSAAEAEAVGDRVMEAGYRGLDRTAVAYGDPDSVAEQLAPFADLGYTDVMLRCMAVPQDAAVRCMELAGDLRARLLGAGPA